MTTKEKVRRKKLAEKQRLNTPAVITPPVNKSEESDDLMAAATMPADALSEDNPGGSNEPVIDDAPLVGDPVTEVPERTPTNEELATAAFKAANNGEFEPDPFEIWFSEKCIAAKAWLTTAPGKAHDALIAGWMNLDSAMHDAADAVLSWAYKTNYKFSQRWNKWFPVKATRDQLAEAMNHMTQYVNTGLEEVKQMVASKNVVDRGRLDSLLFAVQANQKVRATKLYASLTGADLSTAKEAIEALA